MSLRCTHSDFEKDILESPTALGYQDKAGSQVWLLGSGMLCGLNVGRLPKTENNKIPLRPDIKCKHERCAIGNHTYVVHTSDRFQFTAHLKILLTVPT